MPAKPQSLLTVAIVTAMSALLSACTSTQPATLSMPPTLVKLQVLQPEPVDETSSYMATMKSRKSAALQPRVAGNISKIFVTAGQLVSAGTPLVQIDPEKQQATTNSYLSASRSTAFDRNSAEQTLHSLQATRKSKEANLRFLQREVQRYNWLASQGAVAKETADNYLTQQKAAEGDLQSIEAQIEAQKSAIAKMDHMVKQTAATAQEQQLQLGYYSINAPFSGVVGDIPFKLGEYVDSTTKVTTVTENKPLEAYVSIPAEKAPLLRKGMLTRLEDSSGEKLGDATIFFISPVAEDSQTVMVKALYANAGGQLRSNQTVTANVVWQRASSLVVPTYAVAHISGQDFVFVAKGNAPAMAAAQKVVSLGQIVGNNYVVRSGLQAGDRLVVSGVQNLIDGAPISAELPGRGNAPHS